MPSLGVVEQGQKSNPQKIPRASHKTPKTPMPNFRAIKISRGTMRPGYAGTITNLRIVLNTQKNPYFNQATQQNTCQTFPTQKIPKSNISNPKNPSIIPDTWNPEIRSTPHPRVVMSTTDLAAPHVGAAAATLTGRHFGPCSNLGGYAVSSDLAPSRGISLGTPVFHPLQELILQNF